MGQSQLPPDVAGPLVEAWGAQQEPYHADRRGAVDAIVSLIEARHGPAPTVADLGGGPGSIVGALLLRCPEATTVVVDPDPVALALARSRGDVPPGALRTFSGDMRTHSWVAALPAPIDAAVCVSAVHHLDGADVARAYRVARSALTRGGALFVADRIPDDRLDGVNGVDVVGRASRRRAGSWTWERWWDEARRVPELAAAFARRAAAPLEASAEWSAPERWHIARLHEAGFASAGVVHRVGPDAVVMAVA